LKSRSRQLKLRSCHLEIPSRHRRIPANCGSVTQATAGSGMLVGVMVFMVGDRFRRLALDRGKKLSR